MIKFFCILLYSYLIQRRRCFMKATTVRINDDMLGRIDCLANTLSRSRSWVINQAIEQFIGYEEWFVQEVKDGLKEIDPQPWYIL